MTVALASVPDLPIVIRPAAPSELDFVRSSWNRRLWQNKRTALPAYDARGQQPRDEHGNARPEKAPYASLGAPSAQRHMLIDGRLLMRAHMLLVDEILAWPRTQVIVATLPDVAEPMGWACFDGLVLHYVFVRDDCRRERVATRLVVHTGCSAASHVTPAGRPLMKHLRRGA